MNRSVLYPILLCFTVSRCLSQELLLPGGNSFDKKWLKNANYEMTCFAVSGKQMVPVSSFTVKVNANTKTIGIYTVLTMLSNNEQWIDTSIADANSLKPLYRSSVNPNRTLELKYDKAITGYYFDKQAKKKHVINEASKEPFFDSYFYPYLLGSLPLNSGYRTTMKVYDYKPANSSNIKTTRVEEVRTNMYTSEMTGEHSVWQVSVFEEATGEKYEYYIDKDSRRLWKIEIQAANGQRFLLLDKELDYNPFTTTFNKEETLSLIKDGTATIEGVAFARDNENEGVLKGMAILNINKKQYAKMGTSVVLIPYTPYFKEWVSLNEKFRKKGRSLPLSKEAAACIKTTTVYDNDGHFEFTNLKPGEYLLYTEFGYVHTTTKTEVVGYTDTYINGMFQGSSANTETYKYGTNAVAGVKKIITIKKVGEKLAVKLKKTL
ncbi:hypothetical protein [Sediminibacterium sp.]|uniref:DUF3108 domain-containing protein n=1 Tax=Sediminibacterium sp. TaxID=1917865 RepID=UPI0025DB29E5|nr:hypothetical protein [Sediminibacterium sp.]MBW0178388.1 hypothetical protein [Sediminibacterium sp.]